MKENSDQLIAHLRETNLALQARVQTLETSQAQPGPWERITLLDHLAVGAAHELNNMLTVINGTVGELMTEGNLSPTIADSIREIYVAGERSTQIIRRLSRLTLNEETRQEIFALDELAGETFKLLRPLLPKSFELELEPSLEPHWVEADQSMIQQILLILAFKARDAMPDAGRLWASIQDQPPGFIRLCVRWDALARSSEMTNSDESFYLLYDLVKRQRGSVQRGGHLDHGASLEIFLPAAPPADRGAGAAENPAQTNRGSETILLVEDEPAVRWLAKVALQKRGYRALEAVSAEEAISVWDRHQTRIKLLLTDLVLPGEMNGPELARRLCQEKPSLKVIYTSGYSSQTSAQVFDLSSSIHFLPKPYAPAALVDAIRRALAESPVHES
jgi:two-component system cell cycle sensor histidine kinase/response regulator CckA